jgi:hypothetical protein
MIDDSNQEREPHARSSLALTFLIALVLLLGIAIRARVYMNAPGLIDDDAGLCTNILARSERDLIFTPLEHDQAAPPAFLLLTKELVRAFGSSESVFRLPAFIASVLTLLFYVILARQTLGPWGQCLGMTLMAFDSLLVYFGARVKQYSTDVLATTILISLGIFALRQQSGRARFLLLAAIGGLLIPGSHPSVFVLGGIGLTLIGTSLADRRYRDTAAWVAVSSFWLIIFAANYFLIYRQAASNQTLVTYWSNAFAPLPPRSVEQLKWYYDNFIRLFSSPMGLTFEGISAAAFLFGLYVQITRGQGRLAILLVSPILVTLVASALKKYPFSDRLILFFTPLLATLIAAGFDGIKDERPQSPARVFRGLLLLLLLVYPTYMSFNSFRRPFVLHDIKPALDYVADHWQPGDAIYANHWSKFLTDYYIDTVDYRGLHAKPWFIGAEPRGQTAMPDMLRLLDNDFAPLVGKKRVWFVFTKSVNREEELSTYLLDRRGTRLDLHRGKGSTVYLYDLGVKPTK